MGHVFVVPGDITHLACDAWLLPTDRELAVTDNWLDAVEGLGEALDSLGAAADDLRAERALALALPRWRPDRPVPVLTAVPLDGVRSATDVEQRIGAGLAAAASAATTRRTVRRARPLVAMPLFGSAAGGGDALRGELIRAALDTARDADPRVDVALVLREPADLAQAHDYRRRDEERWWPELDAHLRSTLSELAGHARRGLLVPFIGAGVSMSAGLPSWGELVGALAEDRIPADQKSEFEKLSVLDQAEILQDMHGSRDAFTDAIARHTRSERYGLAPALLAALPTTEAVTLNYDRLYEAASEDAGRVVAVLPDDAAEPGDRWLLKLHGSVSDPATIVLTRRDYLGYRNGREALSALAKALLLTRHLLFVGFGLTDDHFHEVMHDVRSVAGARRRRLGTALVLSESPLRDKLWASDLDFVVVGGADVPSQGRRQEIALDHLLAHADRGLGHVLDRRFRHLLSPSGRRLADRLDALAEATGDEEFATPAGEALEELLRGLGHPAHRRTPHPDAPDA